MSKKKKSQQPVEQPQVDEGAVATMEAPVRSPFVSQEVNQDKIVEILAEEIVSNSTNPRESAPALTNFGYGIFTKLEGSDKPAIVPLALSSKPEEQAEYVGLIDKWEQGIAKLAFNMRKIAQRQPVQLRPTDAGYDLIFGCRRFLAALYNRCSTATEDKKPWTDKDAAKFNGQVRAVIVQEDDENSQIISLSENMHRMNMNPMEEARIFHKMRAQNLKVQEIASITNYDHQVVRQRLSLNKLPEEMQAKVEEGEIGVVKAMQWIKAKENKNSGSSGGGASKTGKGHTGDGSRRRVPSVKDLLETYNTRDLDDTYTEQVRKFLAVEFLQIDYMPLKQLRKLQEEEAEKQRESAKRNGEK